MQTKDYTVYKQDFTDLGYDIIGVSKDSIQSHKEFIEKNDLKILLLSDPEGILCDAFDVIHTKIAGNGKKAKGIVRSTFILNSDGDIVYERRNVDAASDVFETLKVVEDLVKKEEY